MMIFALPFVASVVLASAAGAAEDDKDSAGDVPQGQKIRRVEPIERGWFVQADVGVTTFVNEIEGRRFGPGPQVGVFLGYDILSVLNLGLGVSLWGGELDVNSDTPRPRADLFIVSPTLRLQVAVVTTERNFMWVRGDVGFGFGFPEAIDGVDYAGNGPVFGVTAGFERFTKLRHFAIGIHAGVVVVTQPDIGIGVTVTPTLKYTF